ncbi:threonine synthase [bacterium]|nr:threonine synthase [bacterium]
MDVKHAGRAWPGLIEAYREFLPVTSETPVVTLHEGWTPLVRLERLTEAIGLPRLRLYAKLEGANPTGSFKDRGMTMAVTKAKEAGSEALICASTGNTSAAMAAYAARAGMRCYMLVPDGYVALGKLAQGIHYGAKVIPVKGNFDAALALVRAISAHYPVTLVNSVNPFRIEGQKTAAFELCDQLGEAPDMLAIPVGNAGNITAYWKGFKEYREAGKSEATPRMLGFQAAGAAPIVLGRVVEHPETVATAIRIGNPASWQGAEDAVTESSGLIRDVKDAEILEAYRMLGRLEGLFCEPASAASVAGVIKLAREGYFTGDERVACVLTGNGLKDPDTAMGAIDQAPVPVEAEEEAVLAAMGFV